VGNNIRSVKTKVQRQFATGGALDETRSRHQNAKLGRKFHVFYSAFIQEQKKTEISTYFSN
jgi:hypothetical protein